MARRPDGDGAAFNLSPRMMRIGGWVVAGAIIIGIAVVIGVLGGDGEDGPFGPSASASGAAGGEQITFGTAIDEQTGEIPADARGNRFTEADLFAYAVESEGTPPDPVYVEVRRTAGGAPEIVQAPVEGQPLPDHGQLAFSVPADDLFEVFGPGEYLMLIYAAPDGPPIAEGGFVLVGADPSAAASPSASPSASP
jgi:hypothetical protein